MSIPQGAADFAVDYTVPINKTTQVYGSFDTNWRSKQNTTITLDSSAGIGVYAPASARIGTLLDNGRLDVQFWAENLFNNAYLSNLLGYTKSTGIIQGYPGNPRTYGSTVRVKM